MQKKQSVNEISAKDFAAGQTKKARTPMAPEQLESAITKAIRSILNTVGIRHYKAWGGPMSEKGIPDIVAIKRVKVADLVANGVEEVGIFVGIEVKRPKTGVLSPHQIKWKRRIEDSAGIFIEARSVDDAIDGLGIRNRFLF
jgi:hypothetical protein